MTERIETLHLLMERAEKIHRRMIAIHESAGDEAEFWALNDEFLALSKQIDGGLYSGPLPGERVLQ